MEKVDNKIDTIEKKLKLKEDFKQLNNSIIIKKPTV